MRAIWTSWLVLVACGWGLAGCPEKTEADDDAADDDTTGTPADDDAADDDTGPFVDPCEDADPSDPCCFDPGVSFYLCFDLDWPANVPVTGQFSDWGEYGYADIQFVANEGTSYDIWVEGDDEALDLVPDLHAAGEVTVIEQGGCDGKGGFYSSVYVYRGASPGELILLTGSAPAEDLGGWTVDNERDIATCPARTGDTCNEFLHNRPVTFSHGADTWEVYQGELVTTDTVAIRVGLARSASGASDCTDTSTEDNSWFVVPIDVQ